MLNRDFVQRITKSDAAPAKKEETTFELTNLRVEEVSLVDRPANKRTFLVKKRATKKADAPEVKGKDSGEAVVVVDADEVVDIAALGKSEPPGADLDRKDAEEARKKREEEEAAEREREKKLTSSIDEEAAKAAAEPEKPTEAEKSTEAEKPAGDPPPVADKPAGDPPPDDVAKVGKPMARKRLERLKASYKALGDLITELDVDGEEPADKGAGTPAPPAGQPPPHPELVEGLKKSQQALEQSDAEIKRLASLVEALQQMVKSQGEQLAKSQLPVNSNKISLEKSDNDHDKVSWEYDLASPTARLKGRSF